VVDKDSDLIRREFISPDIFASMRIHPGPGMESPGPASPAMSGMPCHESESPGPRRRPRGPIGVGSLRALKMNPTTVLSIKDDKDFLESATQLLESSPSGQKGMVVKKLNNAGKISKKQLYLSLAHGMEFFSTMCFKHTKSREFKEVKLI
jgi:hypothetical protein